LRDQFPGYVAEHGGAFINSDQHQIRNLVSDLGLSLLQVDGGNQAPGGDVYFMDGSYYTYDAANADWGQVRKAFRDALAVAPYPTTYVDHTPESVALDRMTVDEWLDANIPGGLGSRFARLMQTNVIAEYGLDPSQQSALNLIYLLAWNPKTSLDPINGVDEKFTVAGGNDQIVTRMVDQLPPGSVKYQHRLLAVRQSGGSTVSCTFDTGSGVRDVIADRVVLAVPFSTLRHCDLNGAGFSALKQRAICEWGLGTNGKLHLGMRSRPWVDLGFGGVTYSDMTRHQCAWDETAGQPLGGGVLLDFPGGSATTTRWTGTPFAPAKPSDVDRFLGQIEPIFPGTTAAYTGVAYRDAWHLNPWSKGAYTCPRPGQYTTLLGVAATVEGRVHFAGEHTSLESFGYLNGAVESGKRAGQEVAAALA
jgi:monoamine oxidase